MQFNRIAFLASAILALAACQEESAPPISAQSSNGTSSQQLVAAKSSPAIMIDPATMKSCDSIVATVKWDASKVGISTNSTEIWVGSSNADIMLFPSVALRERPKLAHGRTQARISFSRTNRTGKC